VGFVGRTREREDLTNFLRQVGAGNRADAGFAVALRGRRRIGKSRLVDEFIRAQGIPYVWFQSAKGAPADAEISNLAEAIAGSTLPNAVVAQSVKPESLTAVLNLLSAALPTDGPSAVVLDELPWLLEAIPGGAGELQRVWDRTLSRQPVLLILIGSHLAMMEQLTAPDQPFHGRARPMTLSALSPRDVAQMTQLSPFEVFDAYLITGGQPQVIEEWAPGTSPEEFLRDSFASPNSALVASGMRVLDSEFRDAAIARAAPLAAAIVADYRVRFGVGPTWRELSDKLGIPPMGEPRPRSGSPEWIACQATLSELIPELIATGWLADVRGTERSLHPGPRWDVGGASWLENQSTVPNVPAYYFRCRPGVRPSAKEPPDA